MTFTPQACPGAVTAALMDRLLSKGGLVNGFV
jgi:hypothetical protein